MLKWKKYALASGKIYIILFWVINNETFEDNDFFNSFGCFYNFYHKNQSYIVDEWVFCISFDNKFPLMKIKSINVKKVWGCDDNSNCIWFSFSRIFININMVYGNDDRFNCIRFRMLDFDTILIRMYFLFSNLIYFLFHFCKCLRKNTS